jgi:D-alanyl-D-alanine carboxypeptidase
MPALVPVGVPASPPQAQAAKPVATTQATTVSHTRVEIASAVTPSVPAASAPQNVSAPPAPSMTPSAAAAPTVSVAPAIAPAASVSAAAPAEPAPRAGMTAVEAAPAKPVEMSPVQMQPAQIEPAPVEPRIIASPIAPAPAYVASAAHSHHGWLIQIGAFDDEVQAKQHLSAAQLKVHATLVAKDPFTERIQKGDKALYRARFAGFDKATAEAACKALKRSDFECMPLKD